MGRADSSKKKSELTHFTWLFFYTWIVHIFLYFALWQMNRDRIGAVIGLAMFMTLSARDVNKVSYSAPGF